MPRRTIKDLEAQELNGQANSTPQKGRKAIRLETTEAVATVKSPAPRTSRAAKKVAKEESEEEEEFVGSPKASVTRIKINRVKSTVLVQEKPKSKSAKRKSAEDDDDEDADDKKVKKKRKTKEEKEAEAMPLAARTAIGTLKRAMFIGAHVSGAGGVQNAINNSLHIGGNSFALFLKSQRKWANPPLAPDARDQFKAFCSEHNYDAAKHVVPHGSYLVNLAQADAEKANQAYDNFVDDLHRCEALGIMLYNFHPGSTGGNPRPEALARIAKQLNKAHKATKTVVTVIENMAGAGNILGSTWEDLRDIIADIEDKSRVGVCIDTCHTFAAGYDLRSPEAFEKSMNSFSEIVGMSYLKAIHLNDSKTPLSSNRDLHANIGTGFLGLRAFHNVANFAPFENIPMVLETPIEKKGPDGKTIEDKSIWASEIKLLESLIGSDADTKEFQEEEQRLQDVGAEERKKYQGQVDKKKQKTLDSMFKKASPKKKKAKKDDENDSDDGKGCCKH